jgi:2-polyprenyl-3-methyl-5-hydroxy-6-metoxy-1,4-benzoquinol methylase
MGTSLRTGKPEILEWFKENQLEITRILDIGAGSGTYIDLIKTNNSVCNDAEWVAIEAWKPYIEEFKLNEKYNNVINSDVKKLNWDDLGHFSVAVAGDVLEHMSKDDAITLVNKVLDHCNTLIISIPIIHMPQDEINGNPFEVHVKDDWTHEEVLETWQHYIKKIYVKNHRSKIGVYWLTK